MHGAVSAVQIQFIANRRELEIESEIESEIENETGRANAILHIWLGRSNAA
jgi:hypothetical protein